MTSKYTKTHVSAVFLDASFEHVWDNIPDPMNFPDFYPSWTSKVDRLDDTGFKGQGPDGEEFLIKPILARRTGVIDFEIAIDNSVEMSRSRLFEVGQEASQLVHVAVRWNELTNTQWKAHVMGIEDEF